VCWSEGKWSVARWYRMTNGYYVAGEHTGLGTSPPEGMPHC
jgi:hypothetical protein